MLTQSIFFYLDIQKRVPAVASTNLMYLSSRATLALQSPRLSTKNRVLSRTRVSEALIVNYSVVNVYVARKPSGSWEGLD